MISNEFSTFSTSQLPKPFQSSQNSEHAPRHFTHDSAIKLLFKNCHFRQLAWGRGGTSSCPSCCSLFSLIFNDVHFFFQ